MLLELQAGVTVFADGQLGKSNLKKVIFRLCHGHLEIAILSFCTPYQNVILLHKQGLVDGPMKVTNENKFSIKYSGTKAVLAFTPPAECLDGQTN